MKVRKSVNRKGFTIIETLVALVILAVALLGLLAAYAGYFKYSSLNTIREQTSKILEEKLDYVRSLNYDNVTTSLNNGAANCSDALSKSINTGSINVGNLNLKYATYYGITNSTDYKIVAVDVCWRYRGKLKSISSKTVVRKRE